MQILYTIRVQYINYFNFSVREKVLERVQPCGIDQPSTVLDTNSA